MNFEKAMHTTYVVEHGNLSMENENFLAYQKWFSMRVHPV